MLSQLSGPGRARFSLRLSAALLPAALLMACGDAATTTGRVYRDPLTFGRTSLPVAYQGEPYDETLEVRGGTGPYGLKLSGGELPQGLTLKNQRLAGTPTEKGTFRFTLEASDANLSSKAQEYTLNVSDLPPLKLSLELPPAEIRGATRIPLNIVAPRTARAARVTWELPAGAKVTRVQGGPSNGVLKWKQQGQTLTLDLGFKTVPQTGEQVALLHVDPAGRPLKLDAAGLGFRVLDGSGKELAAQLTPAQQAAQKAAQAPAASGAATAPASAPVASGPAVSEASAATASGVAASGVAASGATTAPQAPAAPAPADATPPSASAPSASEPSTSGPELVTPPAAGQP